MNIEKTSYPDNAMAFVFGDIKERWPEDTFRDGALEAMNETLRRRFLLRFVEKKTLETIGAEEGVSSGTIRSGLKKAKRKILAFYFPKQAPVEREIDRIGLSKRPYGCLVREGYTTLEEIETLGYGDLLIFRGMGVKSANEVLERIRAYKENRSDFPGGGKLMDKKEILITVMDEGVISFGQRVYVLDKTDCKIYTEKCPICDDAKKISVKGMEFDCPYCRGYRTEGNATQFSIYDYAPSEYIINKIEIIGEENRSAYSKDGCIVGNRYPTAKYSGFTKFGNSLNSIRTRSFSRYDFRKHSPNEPLLGRSIGGEYCFLLKADAKAFSKRIHERQKEMLDRFNTEHGTNHKYPFEY